MCVIISIYNNKKSEEKRDFLTNNLSHFNTWNADGTAFFGFDTERETKNGLLRDLKMAGKEIFSDLLKKYNVSHFHFRNATQGKVDNENIHFWKYKNWIMAHNGQVYAEGTELLSDSNLLFRDFINAGVFEKEYLDINRVNKIVKTKSFWGRLLFINTESKQSFYFGDFYLSVLDKKILVVSTTQLKKDKLEIYGLEFQTQASDIIEGKMEGIFRIDAKKQEFKKYKLEFNKKDYSGGSFNEYDEYNGINRAEKKWKKKHKQGSFMPI